MNGKNNAGGSADARDLFDRYRIADVIHPGAAFSFGDCNTGEPQFGGLAKRVAGEMARLVDFFGQRLHFRFGEFADRPLQQILLFSKFKIHKTTPGPGSSDRAVRASVQQQRVKGEARRTTQSGIKD